jgi:hypothetical protein
MTKAPNHRDQCQHHTASASDFEDQHHWNCSELRAKEHPKVTNRAQGDCGFVALLAYLVRALITNLKRL